MSSTSSLITVLASVAFGLLVLGIGTYLWAIKRRNRLPFSLLRASTLWASPATAGSMGRRLLSAHFRGQRPACAVIGRENGR